MTTRIYIDESGFSGSNYFVPQDPYFVLSSLAMSEEEALDIKRECFGAVNSLELKHNQLKRRPQHRKLVISYLDELHARNIPVKIWSAFKPYAFWLKVVDYIFEPAMGSRLYRDGQNFLLAKLLLAGHHFTSEDFQRGVASRFRELLKGGTRQTRSDTVNWLSAQVPTFPSKDGREHVLLMLYPFSRLADSHFDEPVAYALDMAFGAALHLMGWWRTDHPNDDLELVHDATANMSRQTHVWEALMSDSVPPHVSATALSGMQLTFPVSVAQTRFEPSHTFAGLQLADVLAGAFASVSHANSKGELRDYALEVIDRIENFKIHAVVPPDGATPSESGLEGTDAETTLSYLTTLQESGRVPPLGRRPGGTPRSGDDSD